jgi:signal transduction histidine kinase
VDPLTVSTAHERPSSGARDLTSSLTRQSLLVAAVCLLADVTPVLVAGPASAMRPQDWLVLCAVALADAALALPARFSGWVAATHAGVQVAAAVITGGSGLAHMDSDAGSLIAAYRAGAWLHGGAAWRALAVLALGVGTARLVAGAGSIDVLLLSEVVKNALLPWLVGRYTTARRGYIAELEQRAEAQSRAAQAAVDHAVAEERSSIARDLHDVISHHVSAINVHAGAARFASAGSAETNRFAESLSAVETSSRAAMLDLRRLLDILHSPADATRQPGLANLEELRDGVRRAGLPSRLSTHGVAHALPDSLDVALYRITQEMLTNAQRHGDGALIDIEVRYSDASVSVAARNGIPAAASDRHDPTEESPPHTRGLAGIRKRATMFGGTIAYGPDPSGQQWETVVVCPLTEQR